MMPRFINIHNKVPAALRTAFEEHLNKYYNFDLEQLSNKPFNLTTNESLVIEHCNLLQKQLAFHNIDSTNIIPVVFIGNSTTNGHAFLWNEYSFPFYCVEFYNTREYSSVFTTHEYIHALHYLNQPEFYFSNELEKASLFRQLVTEGIATYCTQKLLDNSSFDTFWADVITLEESESWTNQCEDDKQTLCKYCLTYLDCITTSELFFYSNSNSPMYNRGGYWLGYMMITDLMKSKELNLKELLSLNYQDMLDFTKDWLHNQIR